MEGSDLKQLLNELGEELISKRKDINSAIVCYIISQSVELVVDLWKKRALFFMKKHGTDRTDVLYHLFEKCLLLRTACKNQKPLVDLDLIFVDVADCLINEGYKQLAMKYIELCNPKQANVAFLKERIYSSDSTRNL